MPPGVTGLWQVRGRNQLSFEDMVRLDLDYIEQWSIGLDIGILLPTVPPWSSIGGHEMTIDLTDSETPESAQDRTHRLRVLGPESGPCLQPPLVR